MSNAPATTKQINFIASLRAERNLSPLTDDIISQVTKDMASQAIKTLLEMPKPQRPTVPSNTPGGERGTDVPAGRYAITSEQDGTLHFFRVDRPTEGRWAGYVFVKRQAGDDLFPVKNSEQRANILRIIAQDPQVAMLRYGQEIGACGHCGRTLTNEESRERGIGPVCAGHMGW